MAVNVLIKLKQQFINIKYKAEDIPVSLKSVTDNKYIFECNETK